MLPRLALFFLVAFLALIVVGAEDYYKVYGSTLCKCLGYSPQLQVEVYLLT